MSTVTLERPKKKRLSEITEADVLEAAVEQLEKDDGYTSDNYFRGSLLAGPHARPGPNVVATCAIGSVEQAIWRLTKQIVTPERGSASQDEVPASKRHTSVLYADVMRRLNAIAKKRGYRYSGFHVAGCPIENLTFVASKRVVVNVFKKALEEARV